MKPKPNKEKLMQRKFFTHKLRKKYFEIQSAKKCASDSQNIVVRM